MQAHGFTCRILVEAGVLRSVGRQPRTLIFRRTLPIQSQPFGLKQDFATPKPDDQKR
jgi:hypothetical protein